jgi:hypothetical protein
MLSQTGEKNSLKMGKKKKRKNKYAQVKSRQIDRVPTLKANNAPVSPVTPCSIPLA